MGYIKTTPQVDERGKQTGNLLLEITYGGKEAPFGGIDSSAPPEYINPNCAVDIQGFMAVKNDLIAVAMDEIAITITLPTGGFTVAKLVGMGSFYTEAQGWQNFIVIKGDAYTNITDQTVAANVALYVWPSANTASPTAKYLDILQNITSKAATPATLDVLTTIYNPVGGTFGTITVTITDYTGTVTETYGPYASSLTESALVTALNNDIATRPSAIVTSVVNADGISLTLTTIATGASANNTQFSAIGVVTGTFKGVMFLTNTGFQGGVDGYTYPAGEIPDPVSWTAIGENLYIGGPGTVILQYTNQIFSILAQYVGANTLKKYAGYLVALGITPSPGTQIDSAEMVIAWSANQQYSTWNPTDTSGNVTGAGFEQLEDISDPITGGFIAASTMTILRAEGISYAYDTGNGLIPFDINHTDLSKEGEGCQDQVLNDQYGPFGFFIGNTNIYSYTNQVQQIGDKIKSLIFSQLSPTLNATKPQYYAKALGVFINNTEEIVFAIFINSSSGNSFIYFYHVSTGIWTRVSFPVFSSTKSIIIENWPLLNSSGAGFVRQPQLVLGVGDSSTNTFLFYALKEKLADATSLASIASMQFPIEEISFGRDITIDGVYAYIGATPGVVVDFYLYSDGNLITSSVFTVPGGAAYNTVARYKIYFGGGAWAVKNPQLQFIVKAVPNGAQLRIRKLAMFGSMIPEQRPV